MPYLAISKTRGQGQRASKPIARSSRVFSQGSGMDDTTMAGFDGVIGEKENSGRPNSVHKRLSAGLRRISRSSALSAVDNSFSEDIHPPIRPTSAATPSTPSVGVGPSDSTLDLANGLGLGFTGSPYDPKSIANEGDGTVAPPKARGTRNVSRKPVPPPTPGLPSNGSALNITARGDVNSNEDSDSDDEPLRRHDTNNTMATTATYSTSATNATSATRGAHLAVPGGDKMSTRKPKLRRSFLNLKAARHSPSLQSLRSFISDDKRSGPSNPPVISPPVFVDSSHSQLRGGVAAAPASPALINTGTSSPSNGITRLVSELSSRATTTDRSLEEVLNGGVLMAVTLGGARLHVRGDRVLKVVPLDNVLTAASILRELEAAEALQGLDGFAHVKLVAVVDSQFGVLDMPYVGTDLRRWASRASFQEKADALWAVARALARAENAVQFEHRNLHSGHVCISKSGKVSILDFGYARFGDGSAAPSFDTPGFSRCPEVLPTLRRQVGRDTAAYVPSTNVLWLAHLAHELGLRRVEDSLRPARWTLKRAPHSATDAVLHHTQ